MNTFFDGAIRVGYPIRHERCRKATLVLAEGSAVASGYGATSLAGFRGLSDRERAGEAGADHRSLAERVRAAVGSACARRGLARRTKQCYGAWLARYATFAGDEREVLREETATRFLTSVVDDEDCCAYSTQIYLHAAIGANGLGVVSPLDDEWEPAGSGRKAAAWV